VTAKVKVSWVVTPRSVVGHQLHGVPCLLHLQGEVKGTGEGMYICATFPESQSHSPHPEDGESKVLRSVGVLSQHYASSQARGLGLETSSL